MDRDKKSTKHAGIDVSISVFFTIKVSNKALDKPYSLCLTVLTLQCCQGIPQSRKLKGLPKRIVSCYNFLIRESIRSSIENSAFGNLVKFYLDIYSLLLFEITSLFSFLRYSSVEIKCSVKRSVTIVTHYLARMGLSQILRIFDILKTFVPHLEYL